MGRPDLKSEQGNEISGQITGLDSLEMGQSSCESGQFTTEEEIEFLQELVDQLERERKNLLLGNREIYQELNKVDANTVETVSTLRKIARENSILRHQLAEAHDREDSSLRERQRSHGEREGLARKVVVLKQALQQASTASSFSASLQHEVTRLTQENLVRDIQLLHSCVCTYIHVSLGTQAFHEHVCIIA